MNTAVVPGAPAHPAPGRAMALTGLAVRLIGRGARSW